MATDRSRKERAREPREQSALESFRALQAEIDVYHQRIQVVDSQAERFRPSVLARVRSDYGAKIDELTTQIDPLRVRLETEKGEIETELQGLQTRLDQAIERLEELELRHLVGEIEGTGYDPRREETEGEVEQVKGELRELERQAAAYNALLKGGAEEPAEAESDQDEFQEFDDLEGEEGQASNPEEEAEIEEEEADAQPQRAAAGPFAVEASPDLEPGDSELEEALDSLTSGIEEPAAAGPAAEAPAADFGPEDSGVAVDDEEEDLFIDDLVEEEPSLPQGAAVLEIAEGDARGTAFEIGAEVTGIGRGSDNAIQLATDTSVSRHHARITYRDGRYVLTDLASSNGTYVNGIRIREQTLVPNDTVMVGTTRMIFKIPGREQYLT